MVMTTEVLRNMIYENSPTLDRLDVVVLDEAQRIKNWSAKTSQAIKRLRSRYAFILTGTPIENRIDEIFSLMAFLDPCALGPLFRFNREHYELDDRGRPMAYRNLDKLHQRIKPFMLRRRKADVETELPERSDRTFFVPLSTEQQTEYENHEAVVAREGATAGGIVGHERSCELFRRQRVAGDDESLGLGVVDEVARLHRLEHLGRVGDELRPRRC